jgi:cell division protein FtsN
VREWISRFCDPDNPIQIGARAGGGDGHFLDARSEAELDDVPPDPNAPAEARPRRAPAAIPRPRGRDPHWISLAAGAILVVSAAIVVLPRLAKRPAAPSDSATVTSTTPAETPTPETPPSRAKNAVAARSAAPARRRSAPADSTQAARRWQGLEVATYLDPYRASAESERLSESTGLSGRVMQTSDQQGEAYRVVLGSFSTRRKAERTADDLVRRGLIEQARVVPLGTISGSPE